MNQMQFKEATHLELQELENIESEFRAYWQAIRPPFPCVFNGTRDDIRALDYLHYEGLSYPASGMLGASLVWGSVLEKNGPFRWLTNEHGDYLLYSDELQPALIWPYARVVEIHSSAPQDGKYEWLLERAVIESLSQGAITNQDKLLKLLNKDSEGFKQSLEKTLGRLEV